MAYAGQTGFFRIPYTKDGDTLSGSEELKIASILENQCRGAILAAGSVRVFDEGTYNVVNGTGDIVTVTLSGTPAARGLCAGGFLEVFGTVSWFSMSPGTFWYLYIQGGPAQYINPSAVTYIISDVEILQDNHLFMATLDNTVAGSPVLDTTPAGKPIGDNLFDLLNSPIDPFGSLLTQSNLHVTNDLQLDNGSTETFNITQASPSATVPLIRIINAATTADISSSGELRFQDTRLSAPGVPLTDASNSVLPYSATSLYGALRAAMTTPTVVLTDAATIATDASLGNVFQVTLGGNRTLGAPTNPVGGQQAIWRFIQDVTGTRTIALNAIFNVGSDINPILLSVGGGAVDYLEAVYNAVDTKWDVVSFVRSEGSGGEVPTIVETAVLYTTTSADDIVIATGTFTVTLHALASAVKPVTIKSTVGGGTVTIDANAAETIDGALTKTLLPNTSLTLVPTSTEWVVV